MKIVYKKCKECLANYPDSPEYIHECDGLMKFLVQYSKAKSKKDGLANNNKKSN